MRTFPWVTSATFGILVAATIIAAQAGRAIEAIVIGVIALLPLSLVGS